MPNWVYNSVVVDGPARPVRALYEKISAPNDHGRSANPRAVAEDIPLGRPDPQLLSFWNIVAPDNLEEYFTDDNWYDWNCANWGTKWDLAPSDFDDDDGYYEEESNGRLQLHFSTAWSPPSPILEWFSQYARENSCALQWHWEEEQGFGEEITIDANGEAVSRSWDVPNSHADYVALGRQCPCADVYEDTDMNIRYDDCPAPEEVIPTSK